MSIQDEFRTEVFTADDGDPGLRWLTDEQVIERMGAEIERLRAENALHNVTGAVANDTVDDSHV